MKVVVVGGGAAGIVAAIAAAKSNSNYSEKGQQPSQVFILEKNEKLGKKLFITGKGRCNLTNACDKDEFFKNIVRNPKFLYSAFSKFSNKDLMDLVETNGCPLKIERGNRVFPVSDKSYDVIDALKKAVKEAGVKVKLNSEVLDIKIDINKPHTFLIKTKDGEVISADKVIIATGGMSYQSTGSTGDGYKFAKEFGITVNDQSPSLVPLNIKEMNECKIMQGLTLKNIAIKIFSDKEPKKILYKDFGELLFTHFGVSGPVILSSSCYINDDLLDNNTLYLSIDLKPALSEAQLDDRLLREFNDNKNKKLKSIIELLLPSSMVEVFIDRIEKIVGYNTGINGIGDMKVSDVNKDIRKSIIMLLKDFRFIITSKRGFDEAVITRGGIDIKEINPKTMESKKVKGLYFAGEVIDVDALTGGFNIQIAASTGFLAGESYAI